MGAKLKSLLARLLMVVTIALLPAIMVQIFIEYQIRQERSRLIDEDARRLLHLVSAEQQRIIDGAEQVLNAIIAAPAVQDDLPDVCHRFLTNLIQLSPHYSVAAVIDLDGRVTCAPHPIDPLVSLANRTFFRLALQTGGLALGDYVIGNATGRATLHLAKPFARRDGIRAGVVAVGIDLDVLREHLKGLAIPPGASLLITDRNGRVLARYPEAPGYVGEHIQPQNQFTLAGTEVATAMILGKDGHERFTAYSPPAVGVTGLLISVGLDPAITYAGLTEAHREGLILVVASMGLALALTAVLGTRLIRRPISQLTAVAEQWESGALTARTGLAGEPSEFGRLAAAFERMAQALAAREALLHGLTNDLEERVREEVAAREAAQAQAMQAERMQALGQLAGGVAHDINNVLQGISGAIALIERRAGDQAGIRRLTRISNKAVSRGISVTRRLLTFGRRGDLHADALDVSALLTGIQEILTHTLGADIHVKVVVDGAVESLIADKGQLETVLVNLSTNAREAMPTGGQLVIAARCQTVLPGAGESIAGLAAGRYVQLDVSDSGMGMDAATLARAREPFFTTKPPGVGTGLGLAMAHGFAEQSGGALRL